ncbi:MAG: P1 family peptidase [Paracoccaceae bacterium]
MAPGPKNLITDVPGVKVGNAQDYVLKSGATVLTADRPFTASVNVMGGAPGTRETDLLAPDKSVARMDAITLSGGSAFGLDACSGVAAGLRAQGRGFRVADAVIPITPGAIIFDLLNGGNKDWRENPYPALGRAALETAGHNFDLGSIGAGTGALTAMHKGGLGSASLVLDDGTVVGALVVVNPMGSVTTPGERHFWAAPFEIDSEFGGLGPDPAAGLGRQLESRKMQHMISQAAGAPIPDEGVNTTIAIVATDADLDKAQCLRMATAAHDGLGRAIVPAHSPGDGDLVFAVSTNERTTEAPDRALTMIGHAAALCLSRAIGRAVFHATPASGDVLRCWSAT